MKKHFYIYFLALAGFATKAGAQAPYFKLVPGSVSTQIKGKANDSLSLFYKCVYIGDSLNSTFSGVVYTNYRTNKDSTPTRANDSFNTERQVPPLPLNSGDTFGVYCHIPVTSNYFSNGRGNLIVIWPTGGRSSNKVIVKCSDTFQYASKVAISGFAGIGENADPFGALNIYPNPANTYLNIQNTDPELKLKLIRVLDFRGKEVMRADNNLERIDVSLLKPGTYFLELNSAENDRTVYTFIISR